MLLSCLLLALGIEPHTVEQCPRIRFEANIKSNQLLETYTRDPQNVCTSVTMLTPDEMTGTPPGQTYALCTVLVAPV